MAGIQSRIGGSFPPPRTGPAGENFRAPGQSLRPMTLAVGEGGARWRIGLAAEEVFELLELPLG